MLQTGLKGYVETEVTSDNTAAALGSGTLAVFATPAMISLMEKASCSAIEGKLEEGQTTVGVRLEVDHLVATPVGMTVCAESELIEIDRRKLTFSVGAFAGDELVGKGIHQRFIVDTEKFMAKAQAKKNETSQSDVNI